MDLSLECDGSWFVLMLEAADGPGQMATRKLVIFYGRFTRTRKDAKRRHVDEAGGEYGERSAPQIRASDRIY